jgi:hypothetical protein
MPQLKLGYVCDPRRMFDPKDRCVEGTGSVGLSKKNCEITCRSTQAVERVRNKIQKRMNAILNKFRMREDKPFNMVLRVVFEKVPYILAITLTFTESGSPENTRINASCNGVLFSIYISLGKDVNKWFIGTSDVLNLNPKSVRIERESWFYYQPYNRSLLQAPAELYFYLPELMAFMISGPETSISISITDAHHKTTDVQVVIHGNDEFLRYEYRSASFLILSRGVSIYENKNYKYKHRSYTDDTFMQTIERMRAVPLSTVLNLPPTRGDKTVGNFVDAHMRSDFSEIYHMFNNMLGDSYWDYSHHMIVTGLTPSLENNEWEWRDIFIITPLVKVFVEWAENQLGGADMNFLYKTRAAGDKKLDILLAFDDVEIMN